MVSAEGEFPKIGNDPIYVSEFNNFYERILEVYTGTDLDGSGAGAASHELTATTFDIEPTYINIKILALMKASASNIANTRTSSVTIKIEVKDIGGSYSSVFDRIVVNADATSGTNSGENNTENCIEYLHTLTANEKTNGFQIKITATRATSGSANAVFTNDQIVVEHIS